METVSVKLVVFKHPEPARWDIYASYCPATKDFCAHGKSIHEVVEKFKSMLIRDLQNRLAYVNMKNYGWEVSENSAKPPTFADEYLISETERIFEVTIKEPIIITVDVELPKAEKQFEISTEVFIDFLMTNGYLGKMKMHDAIELSKGDGYVKVPNLPTLTKEMILASLSSTKLSFADLEEYLENIAAMKSFIDLGIETPPFHKKK